MLRLLRSVVLAACDGVIHADSGCDGDGDSGGDNDADSDSDVAVVWGDAARGRMVALTLTRGCQARGKGQSNLSFKQFMVRTNVNICTHMNEQIHM